MSDKPAMRVRLRAARAAAATTGVVLTVPAAFVERLRDRPVVAAYLPTGVEADPAPLVAAARAAGCRLALPRVVDRATPLQFLAWEGEMLETGPWGLRQPRAEAPVVAPEIIVTPLIGFDRRGHRLGQGAAHYDRAFAVHPLAWRVGVAWAVQEVPAVTPDAWDMPLHAILTEREWIVP